MNKHHAQQLLIAYRPGLSEPTAEMAEALALAERDPELQSWLREQHRFHATVRHQFRATEVPADLKSRILAGRKVVPLWRRNPLALCAAAAAGVLLLGLSAMWFSQPREEFTFGGYQSRMVGFALREYRMDVLSEDAEVIRGFLRKQSAPADYAVPTALTRLPTMGGAKLSWQGKPVSMLCYKLPSNEIAYLFVLSEASLPDAAELASMPQFAERKGLSTATWKSGANVYFLAAPLQKQEIKSLLQDATAAL